MEMLAPWRVFPVLLRQRWLIVQFTQRDVLGRYKGSVLGLFLTLVRPLLMLVIYTIVFGYIFKSRFSRADESPVEFALALFCGLIIFDFLAECLGRAPALILSVPNYVTKVVFPLEVLPVSLVGSALLHLIIDTALLLFGCLVIRHFIPLTVLQVPLILIPLILALIGLTWIVSSVGVFLRDINSVVRPLLTIIMYASAIFYPISKVPESLRPIVALNPLAILVEQARRTILWGMPLQWAQWGISVLVGLALFLVGYAFFMRTKHAFADVM